VSDPAVEAARFAWERGRERLDAAGPERAAREAVARAVHDELRRRVGSVFTMGDLARAWAAAPSWFPDVAAQAAPKAPEAWNPEVTLDGAFGRYMREAKDRRG